MNATPPATPLSTTTKSNLIKFRLPYTRGNPNGKFCFVGEAPGYDEWRAYKKGLRDTAFIGESGDLLNKMIGLAGIPLDDCYFTNVYKTGRPPDNDIKAIGRKDIEQGIKLLRSELSLLPNCTMVIPVGNLALQAVTGIQTIKWKPKNPNAIKTLSGIGNYRGSILRSVPLDGRPEGIKTIPTWHPAFVMRQWKMKETAIGDLERARDDALFPELRHPSHNIITSPNKAQTLAAIREAKHAPRICTDIENKGFGIFCLGIAVNKTDAICIPFEMPDGTSYWSLREEAEIWLALEDCFRHHKGHVGQFYFYDAYYYHHYGLIEALSTRFNGLVHDTFSAHVCLYGELPHSLAYLCSVYTRQPYYKEEGRNWKRGDDILDFWLYNGKDVCLTMEVSEILEKELEEWGKTEFYKKYYIDLFPYLLQTSVRGIAIDEVARLAARKDYRKQWVELQNRLQHSMGRSLMIGSTEEDIAGWKKNPDYVNVESHIKLRHILTDLLCVNVKSTAENYLKKLRGQLESSQMAIINTILSIKGLRKTKESFLDPRLGHDRRFHFILKTSTETGRLAGQKDPFGFGANPQTIPDGVCRSWIIADPGMCLLYVDLSQAEARIVAWLSRCQTLIKMFDEADEGGICECGSGMLAKECCKDIHKRGASLVFSKPIDLITREERQLGKIIRHARNYKIGANTFSANAGIPVAAAKKLLRLDAATYPEIPRWWDEISAELSRTRKLVNPFGRERIFFGRPYDDDTLREALAFIPQSTVPDIVNLAYMEVADSGIQVLMQGHDALLAQVYQQDTARACRFIKKAMEIPITINRIERLIPAEPAIGECWDGDQMCSLEEWEKKGQREVSNA